jgi:hypothetical protein
LVVTEKAMHQSPHLDIPGCTRLPVHQRAHVLHLPLCKEGLALQIWDDKGDGKGDQLHPKLLYVPFGMALLLRADVLHAGCYGNPGNIRFHCILKPEGMVDDGSKLEYIWNQKDSLMTNTMIRPEEVLLHLTNERHRVFSDMYTERLKETFPSSLFWKQDVTKNIMFETKEKSLVPVARIEPTHPATIK